MWCQESRCQPKKAACAEGKGESWEAPHRAQALENRVDSHGCGEELPPFELLIAAGLAELRAQRLRRG